jgi:hypothetical protein
MPSEQKSGQFWVRTPPATPPPEIAENPQEIEELVRGMSGVLESDRGIAGNTFKSEPAERDV